MSAAAVTGMGCVSALGTGVEVFWAGLNAGQTGIKRIAQFGHEGLRNTLAGCVELGPKLEALRHERKLDAGRLELFAVCAIEEALADAGWSLDAFGGARSALVLGTSLGMSLVAPTVEGDPLPSYDDGATGADLTALAQALGEKFHVEDHTLIVSTACASGTHAIALARDLLERGEYDVVVAGGSDALDRMKYLGHSALATLTEGIPRPFSRQRDGTLFGEGAAFLVLERVGEGARGRAYGYCSGAGYSTDIHHLTAPDPAGRGAAAAMSAAIADAGLHPEDVDHVNLHGSGTALNDEAEALALAAVFGRRARDIDCTSIKAAVGHAMGAAGAIEAVATVLSIQRGEIPPTLNVSASDLAFEVGLVCERSVRKEVRAALNNSFGFGGANGVVLFSAADGD
ncbi:MAG TPA: beta-ketoacyl-[acyl-carrier-protein] synthase family protein, partial [Myxococcaceae bacterium]|nr:beta-ketoacyl-[acyl-carrier-protein] synthase family protein [Myxococcaceae bacterium]